MRCAMSACEQTSGMTSCVLATVGAMSPLLGGRGAEASLLDTAALRSGAPGNESVDLPISSLFARGPRG